MFFSFNFKASFVPKHHTLCTHYSSYSRTCARMRVHMHAIKATHTHTTRNRLRLLDIHTEIRASRSKRRPDRCRQFITGAFEIYACVVREYHTLNAPHVWLCVDHNEPASNDTDARAVQLNMHANNCGEGEDEKKMRIWCKCRWYEYCLPEIRLTAYNSYEEDDGAILRCYVLCFFLCARLLPSLLTHCLPFIWSRGQQQSKALHHHHQHTHTASSAKKGVCVCVWCLRTFSTTHSPPEIDVYILPRSRLDGRVICIHYSNLQTLLCVTTWPASVGAFRSVVFGAPGFTTPLESGVARRFNKYAVPRPPTKGQDATATEDDRVGHKHAYTNCHQ